ncbi:hypothetical protein AAVH_14911 [Aphelenchoides avenae]|nr:hypothetical protein AAVH_14911 [Aphelenchus avenae]
MHLAIAIITFFGFICFFVETHADDPVKVRHFLQALSYDEFRDLEMHLKNPFAAKGMLLAKVEQLNQHLPEENRLSAYDFLWSLPCIVVGPIREFRAILEHLTPGLKMFLVNGLANFLNEDLTLVDTCKLNRKGLMSLSAKENQVIGIGPGDRADCEALATKLKNLELYQSLNSTHPNALLPFGNGCLH